MKALPLIANIALGDTDAVVLVDAHVLGTIKWIVVHESGHIVGYETEPTLVVDEWCNRLSRPYYLGSVVFEDGDDYRDMKWELQFTDACASTELQG